MSTTASLVQLPKLPKGTPPQQTAAAAPGWPGIAPRWTSSAKIGVGTALNAKSRVWFTLSHGIFNEIYFPRIDQACTRDLGLIVTDGSAFFSEEKRDVQCAVSWLETGVPAFRLVNTHQGGRYRLEKEILADPRRDAVLQRTQFIATRGQLADYRVYALLAPHLGNRGAGNTAWAGDYQGAPMLFAQRGDLALALACSVPWQNRSVGFVGVSDGWQDLQQHKQMTWLYQRAENGNVALVGELDLNACAGEFLLVIGFGRNPDEAGQCALQSLQDGFDRARNDYVGEWQAWQRTLKLPRNKSSKRDLSSQTIALLRVHESKVVSGGIIASLSIPWGFAKGDDDTGGYHLVWPRDLVEAAGGLLAVGARDDVCRILGFLERTQDKDGHWPQNLWIDGTPYWSGIQLDETAFPILLVALARREKILSDVEVQHLWPMVRRAATFVLLNGPVTLQDRWEEDPGYSPFTLAVTIAALLATADLAELNGEPIVAAFLRETADFWNDSIERWTYVTGTDLAQRVGVEGYYVRIAPPEIADAASPMQGFVPIKNRPPGQSSEPAIHIVSPDALAFVRFGLRAPDDPRVVNTVKVIDALLKVETPNGPAWHRYNDDGYGEHADGSAFDGTGIGRAWPLLTGERAHYELAAGRREEAERLLCALESFANEGGLISEQVWDTANIPEKELFCGQPSGAAMPLVWAHAEYAKLLRSFQDGCVFDMPLQPVERYLKQKIVSRYFAWRFSHKIRAVPRGKTLRIELRAPAFVHWSVNGWRTAQDTATKDTGCGLHIADLPTEQLAAGNQIDFTFHWIEADRWENVNFAVVISNSLVATAT